MESWSLCCCGGGGGGGGGGERPVPHRTNNRVLILDEAVAVAVANSDLLSIHSDASSFLAVEDMSAFVAGTATAVAAVVKEVEVEVDTSLWVAWVVQSRPVGPPTRETNPGVVGFVLISIHFVVVFHNRLRRFHSYEIAINLQNDSGSFFVNEKNADHTERSIVCGCIGYIHILYTKLLHFSMNNPSNLIMLVFIL